MVTLFFQSTRADQNSMKTADTKFYEILWCQIEPFGLANRIKKVCTLFPRSTIPGEAEGLPLSFFLTLSDFFSEKFSSQRALLQFFDVLQYWMFKNPKGYPLSARQGPAPEGTWRASSVVWVFHEFDTLFVSLILSFLTFSCPFAIFEP